MRVISVRLPLAVLFLLFGVGALSGCKKSEPEKPAEAAAAALTQDAGAQAGASDADAGVDAGVAVAPFELEGRVAFIREQEGQDFRAMYLDVADGGLHELPIPVQAGSAFPATAMDDGSRVAVLSAKGEEAVHEERLWLVTPGKKGALAVGPPSGRVRNPVFAPDGKSVVFEGGQKSFSDLYSIGVNGKNLRRLTDNPEGNFEASFAPDGSWIVFVSSRDHNPEIYRMSPDGSDESRLTISDFEEVSPRVSPDGQRIAFISNREGDDRVYVMTPLGGNPQRLSPPAVNTRPGTLTNTGEAGHEWSPDGSQVAFSRRESDGSSGIWVASPEGTARMLTSGKAFATPSWSPDGRYLAFSGETDGRAQLFVVEVGSGAMRPLIESDAHDWRPLWFGGEVAQEKGQKRAPAKAEKKAEKKPVTKEAAQ